METPVEKANGLIVSENKHLDAICTTHGKAIQHEMKLVTAIITKVEYQKMEQRNDFYVKFYFDVDNPEYKDLCKYKIYHLTSEGAAKHLYSELMNMGLKLQKSEELESLLNQCMGKKVQLRLVDTDDGNINKYIVGLVKEVESAADRPDQIWGFLEAERQ